MPRGKLKGRYVLRKHVGGYKGRCTQMSTKSSDNISEVFLFESKMPIEVGIYYTVYDTLEKEIILNP